MIQRYPQGLGWFAFISCVSDLKKGSGDEFKEYNGQVQLPPDGIACVLAVAPIMHQKPVTGTDPPSSLHMHLTKANITLQKNKQKTLLTPILSIFGID